MYAQGRWCTAIPVLSALVLMVHGATIKFDQSQTGDYNLQIHLKNIELYAVFDDSGGSDDEYGDLLDYTDPPNEAPNKPSSPVPSPKPSASTTITPSYSGTTAAAAIAASTAAASPPSSALLDPYSPSNSDKIVQMVEALIASNGNTSDQPTEPPAAIATVTPSPSSPPAQYSSSTVAAASATSSNANRKCGPGYFRDPMGRCRRIRKPHLPFLQMVHTPGVIKSFQPQQRTTDDDSVVSKN